MIVEEHFDECPYTGKLCRNAWDCAHCEVETEERLWAEDCDDDRGQYEKGYADGVKDTQVKFESAVAVWLKKWKGYIDDDIIARMCYRICDIARIAAHLEDEDDDNQ